MKRISTFPKIWFSFTMLILIHVATFSQSSKWLWADRFGGTKNDYEAAISGDAAGNIYIAGPIGSPSFNMGGFIVADTLHGAFYVAKLNASGETQWVSTGGGYGGSPYYLSPGPTALANDAAGNTYIAGGFEMDTFIVGNYTLLKTDTGGANTTVFVAKYDENGNVLWAEGLGGGTYARANAIASDANGNIYVTGGFNSDSMTAGNTVLINTGYDNVFTTKISPSGQVIWAQAASGPRTNLYSAAIATSPDGGVLITGWLDSDTGIFGNYVLKNPLSSYLIFVTKYDTSGNVLWAISAGDSSYQYGYAIATDAQSNAYVTGSFTSRNLHLGNTTLANDSFGDGGDIFLAKFDPSGNVVWAKRAGGKAEDLSQGIAVGNAGDLYLSGYFWSRPFVIGNDSFIDETSNGSAMFVAKYDTGGNEEWASFGYSYENITCIGVVPDGEGNAVTAGYFLGTYMFLDTNELINAGTTGTTSNIFVGKAGPGVTGINDIKAGRDFEIYPNPANNCTNIEGLPIGANIYLYDLTGRLLLDSKTQASLIAIDLTKFAPGVYLLQTPMGSKKIIKM